MNLDIALSLLQLVSQATAKAWMVDLGLCAEMDYRYLGQWDIVDGLGPN